MQQNRVFPNHFGSYPQIFFKRKKLSTDLRSSDIFCRRGAIVLGMQREQTQTTLVSGDPQLIQQAQASAAAVGASLKVVTAGADLRTWWRAPAPLLIGADQVSQVGGWAFPRRDRVYLLGQEESFGELCRWSMPLSASVIVLPEGGKWLSRVIGGQAGGGDTGVAVAVAGGTGGAGASTLAVGLAVLAAARPLKVALVDADPRGGGLDLLLGAENTPGWRWDKLRGAVGQIADITTMLPSVEGITLLSMERPEAEPVPGPACEAVVDCLVRSHDLVLVDVGRWDAPLPGVRRSVLITGLTVRAIAATRSGLGASDFHDIGVVARRTGSVPPQDAARAVGLPLIGVLPEVADLPRLADRGIAPPAVRRWRKAGGRILTWCLDGVVARRSL